MSLDIYYKCVCVCVYIYIYLGSPDSSDGKESAYNTGNLGLIPGLGRFPGLERFPGELPGEFHGRVQSIVSDTTED